MTRRQIGLSALLIIQASFSFGRSTVPLANKVRSADRIVIGTMSKIERGAVAVKVTLKSETKDILFDRAEILEPRFLKGPKGLRPVIVFKSDHGIPGIVPKEGQAGIWFLRREEILMGAAPHVLRDSYPLTDEKKIMDLIAQQEREKE